jgi:hypothetical protein
MFAEPRKFRHGSRNVPQEFPEYPKKMTGISSFFFRYFPGFKSKEVAL